MTRHFLRCASIAALCLGVAGVASGQTEELVRTIPMAPGGQFSLTNISGDITVAGADDGALTDREQKSTSGAAPTPGRSGAAVCVLE